MKFRPHTPDENRMYAKYIENNFIEVDIVEKITDKFNQWLKSQDRIPVDAPPGHRCCEEAAREGWEACKAEIVKWLLTLPTDDYSTAGMADRINKEF